MSTFIYLFVYLLVSFLCYIFCLLLYKHRNKDKKLFLNNYAILSQDLFKDFSGSVVLFTLFWPISIPSIILYNGIKYITFNFLSIFGSMCNYILYLFDKENGKILETKISLLQVGDIIKFTRYTNNNSSIFSGKIREIMKDRIIVNDSSVIYKKHINLLDGELIGYCEL